MPLLASIKKLQPKPKEVLFVDDASEDHTVAIIKAAGFRVLCANKKPKNWQGKNWACWIGAQNATGEQLLFLDADTTPKQHVLASLLIAAQKHKGVISVQPFHRIKYLFEQHSLFFNLVVMAGIDAFGFFSKKGTPTGCFGPCIFINKDIYFQTGGHKAIKTELVDDVSFAHLCRLHNIKVFNFGGKGMIEFRMYPEGMQSLVQGWLKNLSRASDQSSFPAVTFLALWITGIFSCTALPAFLFFSFSAGNSAIAFILYFMYVLQILLQIKRIGNFSIFAAAGFPYFVVFFVIIFSRSVFLTKIKKQVHWKNRTIRFG